MLDLKEVSKTTNGLRAVYTVRHNTAALPTILEQDLHLMIDERTGAVTGKLLVEELQADNMNAAIEKLATWCERLAAALREPMKVTTSVPVFEKDSGKAP